MKTYFCDVLHSDIELVLNLYSKMLVQGFNKNISLPPVLGANVVLIFIFFFGYGQVFSDVVMRLCTLKVFNLNVLHLDLFLLESRCIV